MRRFNNSFAAEQLKNELSSILCESKSNFLRVTNIKLVTLFWDIGVLLIQHEEHNEHSYVDTLLVTDSKSLSQIYGKYFSSSNLGNMVRFATEFPFSSVPLIASIVSWEHICAILPVTGWDKRLNFLNVLVEQNLTPQQLTDRIAKGEHSQVKKQSSSSRLKPMQAEVFFKVLETAIRGETSRKSLVGNLLFDSAQSDFRQFINASKVSEYKNYEKMSELCKSLSDLSETTKQEINNCLNAEINKAFWNIGTQVNNELRKHTDIEYDSKALLRVTANQLNKISDCCFSAKHLGEMGTVAEQFLDFNIMLYVSQLISWGHFITLCGTKDIKAKIFYARLTAFEGLSVHSLKKRIRAKKDRNAINGGDIDWIVNALLQLKITEGQIKRRNNTFKWKKTFIPTIDDAAVKKSISNIFENPHFFLLLPKSSLNKIKNT